MLWCVTVCRLLDRRRSQEISNHFRLTLLPTLFSEVKTVSVLQEIGDEKSRLEEKLDAAAHEVTKLRSSTGVLEQQLDLKMVECNALNAELKDNLQRWEQESMQRMLAEEELENKKNELKIAIDEGRKAAAAAGMKDEQHKVAVRELVSCKRRHCSLLSAKVRGSLLNYAKLDRVHTCLCL